MLKRLELVGFKSFADKTTFNFGDGITAIVGPNGSGKSNIVDAVRWIMGEQSAKSLRGGEMADVIFNGSTVRRSLGLAEVTMIFDNRRRQLGIEADEVEITRRVYRNGEGEYLINQQICRLRDIKELFLGSGAGNDAYCVIEQGKVDVLLQASTRERRIIFEEAAGISRFKAKKVETLRKLERVDQNLQRLRDIIDEVDKQLRNVKLQASKAQRYQEYTDRLRELRLSLGLEEYHQFTQKLDEENRILDRLRTEMEERAVKASSWETQTRDLETMLAGLEDSLREQEARLAEVRQHIKTEESTLAHEGTLGGDLETQLGQIRKRLVELMGRVSALAETVGAARRELDSAESLTDQHRRGVQGLEEELRATVTQLAQLQQQVARDKVEHLDLMRRAAHLQNEAVATKAHVDNLCRDRDRLRHKTAQAAESLASLDVELQELTQADQVLQGRLASARQAFLETRQERQRLQEAQDQTGERVSQLLQDRSGLTSRIEVLQGLIRSHEGLGSGVREILALIEPLTSTPLPEGEGRSSASSPSPPGGEGQGVRGSPWNTVLGIIADFLTVKREFAPLIDLALGDWAQRFLVRDMDRLVQALAERKEPFSGRVSFLPIQIGQGSRNGQAYAALKGNRLVEISLLSQVRRSQTGVRDQESGVGNQEGEARDSWTLTPDLSPSPGLVAPAEQVVSCDHPELADLPNQLFGRTLIVRDLAAARAIAEHAPGFRLITLQGELLEPDGTLTVGTFHAATGILSRKSELQDLLDQAAHLERRLAELEKDQADLRERIQALDARTPEQQEEIDVLTEQAADLRIRLEQHRGRRQGLHEEVSLSRDEMQRLDQDIAALEASWNQARSEAAQAEHQVQILHERMHQADQDIRQAEEQRQRQQHKCTQARVELAKVEERLHAIQSHFERMSGDLERSTRERDGCEENLRHLQQRLRESQHTMLRASAALAQAFLDKEQAEAGVAGLIAQRDAARQERTRLADQAQTVRNEWLVQQEHVHNRELEVSDLRHRRDSLSERLREDYQVNLAELYQQKFSGQPKATPEGEENDAPVDEAALLRRDEERSRAASSTGFEEGERSKAASSTDLDSTAVNQEIDELRRKISRLGSVNLEALQELHDLEIRSQTLQVQCGDLTAAKKSLEEIIAKINQDSKRMFLDTFTTIRGHFQELFRKLFGGGMADVVLEDENDVLDCGVEVIARPPGKELRSISLMSGGEKTMTAVALLLAIFRSKPSPFCLLDEVDAALDEANIDRFTLVLREFLDHSQFIIVTHSKKTMTCADVLYGITMQESGVSKQVAVRFEDWEDPEPAPTGSEIN